MNFENFEWFVPKPKNELAITIPNMHTLNFNQKLLPQLPASVTIGVGENGRVLCIREMENGYRVCKNGSIKADAKNLIDRMISLGVRLPARYSVTKEDCCWIARLESEPTAPVLNLKNTPRRSTHKDISGLSKEVSKA